ncbi:MAG TPA: tRNA (guanosine(46)-N7)-methyltransferase TrmB [Ktedonobacteraceae bacterium]|jgi:tRNA (guanine-N7-)-methyltransferase|nr:tRNA (guanosine(46)-N7)-methyltransferase TrmB [Ktedonobacteraceae bacterium]
MGRRKFLRYTRAKHINEQIIQHYVRSFPPADLYLHRERFPQLDASHLFGNMQPLELEIGCGSAEPLCSLAKSHPATNYAGIDISGPSLQKAAEIAASQHLENIIFLHADFHQLAPLFVPQAMRAVYLHFPDPHARPGHQKRRIFRPGFLDLMAYTLQPQGLLSVMTDHEGLFLDMLALLEHDARFARLHTARDLRGFEHEAKSHFQRTWERHGETIFRFEAYLLPV